MSESFSVFWAAFGGAAAAGIFTLIAVMGAEWFRWYMDRPLLRVDARLGYMMQGPSNELLARTGGRQPDEGQQLFLEASNPHSKPVTVSNFGLQYRSKAKGALMIMPQLGYTFPYQVDGGKSLTQWTSVAALLDVLGENGNTPSDLKQVWFKSAPGKEYRRRIPSSVIQRLEELRSPQGTQGN